MQLFKCCIDKVPEIESTTKWFMVRNTIEALVNHKRYERIDVAPLFRARTGAISTRRRQVFITSDVHDPIQLLST